MERILLSMCMSLMVVVFIGCGEADGEENNSQDTDLISVEEDQTVDEDNMVYDEEDVDEMADEQDNEVTDTVDEEDFEDESEEEADTDVIEEEELEIEGTYVDNWDSSHTVSNTLWETGMGNFNIDYFDNDQDFLIAQNDADNDYNAEKWSRFDWVYKGERLFYCQTTYDAETKEDAGNIERADDSDPESGGCGDYAWNELLEPLKITGRYTDNWDSMHHISQSLWHQGWAAFDIVSYNNDGEYLIAQIEEDMGGAFNRFDWTEKDGVLYFCNIVYDAQSAEAATAITDADRTDPAVRGCGDYAWSSLKKRSFAPAADVEGTTAIGKGSKQIVAWASGYVDPVNFGEDLDEEWKDAKKALGVAEGTSTDVVCLGNGGEIVLTFDKAIENGEGFDFLVFENSFSDTFLELAFVEVSSDGENFIRFENEYLGTEPVDTYGDHDPTMMRNLAGKYRQGFGTPFDLDELKNHEHVLNGTVDVMNISHVKIIDIIGDGLISDSFGYPIYDPFPTDGSAGFDLDAVGVINQTD